MNDVRLTFLAADRSAALAAFVEDSMRRLSLGYLAWLVTALAASLLVYHLSLGLGLDSLVPALAVYYTVAGVHVVRRLHQGGRANILRPDIFFLLLYSMFHTAYVALYVLGLAPYFADVFRFEATVPRAMLVVNLGLIGFLAGFELMGMRATPWTGVVRLRIPTRAWCVAGFVLMTIALVIHIAGLFFVGIDVFRWYGYKAIQGVAEYTTYGRALWLSQSAPLMVVGLVLYISASAFRYGRLFQSKAALGIVVAYALLLILEGDRGPLLLLGAPIVLVRHYFIRRVRIRYLTVLFIGTLVVFSAIRAVRDTALAPSEMWEDYRYQRASGLLAWTDPFIEMGSSFCVVNVTCYAVPGQGPYWGGASWLSAALHTVPFLQGFVAQTGALRPEPSKWVTETYWGPRRAGRGFSVSTEGYLNFGFPGACF